MAAAVVRNRSSAPAVVRATALAAVLTVVLAGCGRDSQESPPEPTTAPPSPTLPQIDEVGTPTQSEFPSSPQEYAEAAVAAWAAPDLLRLAELTPEPVHDQIVELPGPPNQAWTFIRCEEDDEATLCSFHNAEGDYLVLTVDHELLAGPQAVTTAEFEAITYPADARDYVQEFVAAWQEGNLARMHRLALPEAVAAFQQIEPGPATGYTSAVRDERRTTVGFTLAEARIDALVSTGLLGEPHAIREATVREQ